MTPFLLHLNTSGGSLTLAKAMINNIACTKPPNIMASDSITPAPLIRQSFQPIQTREQEIQ